MIDKYIKFGIGVPSKFKVAHTFKKEICNIIHKYNLEPSLIETDDDKTCVNLNFTELLNNTDIKRSSRHS